MGYAFISYGSNDRDIVNPIKDILVANGIKTWIAPDDIPIGSVYSEVINEAIKNCVLFVMILTNESQRSLWIQRELERASAYEKSIVPIQIGNFNLIDEFDFILSNRQILHFPSGVLGSKETKNLISAVKTISKIHDEQLVNLQKERLLYSQIVELQHGDAIQFCEKLCDLLVLLVNKYRSQNDIANIFDVLQQIKELYELYFINGLGYGDEYKLIARRIINTLNIVNDALDIERIQDKRILFAAIVVTVLEADHRIRNDCIDSWTNGDVHGEQISAYEERVAPYVQALIAYENDGSYSDDERRIIEDAKEKIRFSQNDTNSESKSKKAVSSSIDERFEAIADYFSKGNELFTLIGQDNKARDFYSCLLMSYERLKSYCAEVGEKRVFGECVIKISELKELIAKIDIEDIESTEAERGIKALLGLTLPKSGNYDAFISYKHYDEDRAYRVYTLLQRHLKEVFFDKVTLPELSKSDYEHAVMTALGHSKHFIVIISDIKILEGSDFTEGDWVRREMRAFNTEIQEGRKKDSEFLILASDEVCDQIFASNKENIDIMWHWQEIIRFSEFEAVLAKYIK